jgi:NDP-sugar pyrophosphorylase family protein
VDILLEFNYMKTIILAAGRSSRMFPIKDKNLLSFCGKPMLIHIIENCERGGLKDFIIVTNKNNKNNIAAIMQEFNKSVIITEQKNLDLGMAGGVNAGLKFINDNEEVFIHNAQDYFDISAYKQILNIDQKQDGAILSQKVSKYFPGGYLKVNKDNIIQSIIEKPGEGNEPSNLVNIVAHYFRRSGDLKKALNKANSNKDDIYEKALQEVFNTQSIKAIPYKNTWQALKYPWHILDMMPIILDSQNQSIHENAYVDPKATIKGLVIIKEGVKILNNATIIGPTYIGQNTVIGQNTLIRQSIVEKNCTIGFNTEIARSYVSHNVSTHACYIGDSVILDNVNYGAFSVTTNLRLDKKSIKMKIKDQLIDTHRDKLGSITGSKSQVGSGAKILPGRIIPPNTFINPNEIFKG